MQSTALGRDLATVFESLSIGVIEVDADWSVLYMNPAAEHMLNVSRSSLSDLRAMEFATRNGEFELEGRWISVQLKTLEENYQLIQLQDVTARKQAETALELNQEFLQAVLDNIESGVVAGDASGTLKLFNNATRQMHGAGEEPIPPDQWPTRYQLYHADGTTLLEKEETPLFRAFSGEDVRRQEIVIASPEGRQRSLLCTGRALTGRDGRKLGAVIAMHDITHRKVSGGRLRHSLRQFRALFNHAPIAYHEVDLQGRIRRVNLAELRLMERTREEMIGRPVWEFVSEQERNSSQIAVAEKLSGKRQLEPFTREYMTPSGRVLLLELHETLIHDSSGAITGIRTALLDVTDRSVRESHAIALSREKAAREQAEMDSAEIRSILERIGDAYMAFDTEWRYTYVNHRAAELALREPSELIGKSVWEVFPDATRTAFYTELQRSMREQVAIDFDNYFAPLGKWFQNSVYPSPSGVGVFYRDITERVRTASALQRRTDELARKNTELETFASVVSHDLQEPLRMIGGYATLLTKRYSAALDADAQEFISYINHGVARMQRLIKDLLALSRLDRPGEPLSLVKVSHVVDLVCGNLELLMEDNHATVEKGELPSVEFNETQLLQVLQNLIGNAIRYRGKDPPRIAISAEREEVGWIISVNDNGQGFEMEYADQIFRPFRRLHRREDGGTGIGLAICRKIILGRGGKIWVNSQPGIGSTFHFSIPDELPVAD